MTRIALTIMLSCATASADRAASIAHYEKARAAYAAASFATAIAELELAYQESPAPEYLHDLGQAYRRSDQACEAIEYFEKYLRTQPAAKVAADVSRDVEALRPWCQPPLLPEITDSLPASPPITISPYALVAGGGVEMLHAGAVMAPAVGLVELGVRRELATWAGVDVAAGIVVSLGRLPYDDVGRGTIWLTTPQLVGDASYAIVPALDVLATAGVGATAISGLDAGNPLVAGGMASDTVVTVHASAALGVAWHVNERMTVRVLPLGYQWSPARGALAADVGALQGFAMSAGVAVAW